ncbi:MAG: glutathione S-transferase family protein [Pseudomonadota bacterium]|nr:glutathione S-transferase family protein [Pseudomonadota bacterium]
MKLYVTMRAPNPRRVQLFLAAKGLDLSEVGLELIQIDLASLENRQQDYLEINPLGQLPALQLDDGTVIADSMAICRYLELTYPEPALFGQTVIAQAMIEQLNRQAEFEVLYPLMLAFQHGHPFWAGKLEQLPEFAPVARRRALQRFDYFERLLTGQEYLYANQLSVADLTLYAGLDFGRLAGLKVDEQHPNLYAYYRRLHTQFGAI